MLISGDYQRSEPTKSDEKNETFKKHQNGTSQKHNRPKTLVQNYFRNETEVNDLSISQTQKNGKKRREILDGHAKQEQSVWLSGNDNGSKGRDSRETYGLQTLKSLTQNYFSRKNDQTPSGELFMSRKQNTDLKALIKFRTVSLDTPNNVHCGKKMASEVVRRKSMPDKNCAQFNVEMLKSDSSNNDKYSTLNKPSNTLSYQRKPSKTYLDPLKSILKKYDGDKSNNKFSKEMKNVIPAIPSTSTSDPRTLYMANKFHQRKNSNNNASAPRVVSLDEIILSARGIQYNGLNLADPINLMNTTFTVSVPTGSSDRNEYKNFENPPKVRKKQKVRLLSL